MEKETVEIRSAKFNEELVSLFNKYSVKIAPTVFITEKGTIASKIVIIDDVKVKTDDKVVSA